MKIVVMDREKRTIPLARGLLPPIISRGQSPAPITSDLYRRTPSDRSNPYEHQEFFRSRPGLSRGMGRAVERPRPSPRPELLGQPGPRQLRDVIRKRSHQPPFYQANTQRKNSCPRFINRARAPASRSSKRTAPRFLNPALNGISAHKPPLRREPRPRDL